MDKILVQMADQQWTAQAIHLACALAQNSHAEVILLQMMPAYHPQYLGTALGGRIPTSAEYEQMQEYMYTAEDYGVNLSIQPMQYISLLDALVDVVDQLSGTILFAYIPPSHFEYWRQLQIWLLQRRLARSHCQLYTLDQTFNGTRYVLSLTVKPAH